MICVSFRDRRRTSEIWRFVAERADERVSKAAQKMKATTKETKLTKETKPTKVSKVTKATKAANLGEARKVAEVHAEIVFGRRLLNERVSTLGPIGRVSSDGPNVGLIERVWSRLRVTAAY